MKRFIILSTLFLFCLAINAQEVKLTIETTAGGLKDAMTQEQRKTVTDLTLTGSMNDSDFYLIRDEMRKIASLNMKHIDVDTIPEKAFYQKRDNSTNGFNEITLPVSTKYIGDKAFVAIASERKYVTIIFTGEFPFIGRYVFVEDPSYSEMSLYNLEVSEDNIYCKVDTGGIYSKDGKTLYYGDLGNYIKDGTESISPRSYFGRFFSYILIPESVKYIGDEAFACLGVPPVPVGRFIELPTYIACESITPPELGENVFSIHENDETFYIYSLYVPNQGLESYRTASQWGSFEIIKDIETIPPFGGGDDIKQENVSGLILYEYSDRLELHCEKSMIRVELMDIQGQLIFSKQISDNKIILDKHSFVSSVKILKVTFKDGTVETAKLNL